MYKNRMMAFSARKYGTWKGTYEQVFLFRAASFRIKEQVFIKEKEKRNIYEQLFIK